jgi:hypothetical protein
MRKQDGIGRLQGLVSTRIAMQDSPFSMSWHHAAAAPLPASGQNRIYRKNDTQLPKPHP